MELFLAPCRLSTVIFKIRIFLPAGDGGISALHGGAAVGVGLSDGIFRHLDVMTGA